MIERGPREFLYQIFAIFTRPGNLVVQPSGAFIAVLTLSWPALVTGFEASRPSDKSRFEEVENRYALRIGEPVKELLWQKRTPLRRKFAQDLACDAGDLMVREIDAGFEKPKRAYNSRKKWRAMPNNIAKTENYRQKRTGNSTFSLSKIMETKTS